MSAEVRILTLLHTRRILEPYVYVKRGTTQTTDAAPAGHHYTIHVTRSPCSCTFVVCVTNHRRPHAHEPHDYTTEDGTTVRKVGTQVLRTDRDTIQCYFAFARDAQIL